MLIFSSYRLFDRCFVLAESSRNYDVMKKIIRLFFILVFGFMVLPSHAATATDDIEIADSDQDWKPVIEALIQVESKGNSKAKSGASVGVLQITPVLVAECNNILRRRKSKKRYKLSDRWSKQKSVEMFLLFQSWFNPLRNVEQAIRSWNGGMHYSISKTQRYFDKVMSILQKNK